MPIVILLMLYLIKGYVNCNLVNAIPYANFENTR